MLVIAQILWQLLRRHTYGVYKRKRYARANVTTKEVKAGGGLHSQ